MIRPAPLFTLLAATFLVAGSGAASAQSTEATYLKRFNGSFFGDGSVRTKASGSDHSVTCTVKGKTSESTASLNGTCRAAIIFSRKIGADLKVDSSGRYTGTYVGSKIGPAQLSGTRTGNTLNLIVTWPKEVNGDKNATMTITNDGRGGFSFIVADRKKRNGPVVKTTSINFNKGR
jgi:hypothetical protein